MFDFAWSHIAIIAVVALVVIGPKDLPGALRTAGVWLRRARGVAREFQGSFDQLIREAELEDVRNKIQSARNFDIGREIVNTVDPSGDMHRALAEPFPAHLPPDAPRPDQVLAAEPGASTAEPPAVPPATAAPDAHN